MTRNRSAHYLGVSPEALERHRESERLRLERMVAKMGAQMERQEAGRNPAFAADWDARHPVRFTELRGGFVIDADWEQAA